ncbi:S-adenosylmethionine transporter [Malassezia obtusa]|uniref:S-adenosylmethionine transporter n=1 Tax=Malassezia obtusa TaxID=76774 RepID=A0AAF0DX73_9BASI|nr:S-adenosylmethionine transporter [Malassezia obtusa]
MPRSLRTYASTRLEKQKHMHELIESTTDVNRLLWEAQVAFSAHQYTLSAVLYRRAAELGNAFACAFLAKLFGFGVVRTNQSVFLFERDTLRGLAWGILAFQRISEQLSTAEASSSDCASQWSLLNQTLTLLCTLSCAPESCLGVSTNESHADISMPLLLLFPRSCEIYTARPSKDMQQVEGTRHSLWSALKETLEKSQDLFAHTADSDDPPDSAQLETAKTIAKTHTTFLEAFLAMRSAFLEKSTASVDAAYEGWLAYLSEANKCPDSANLSRYRRVATEGQQWSAPHSDRKISAVVSEAEHSALSKRISSIFPFASDTGSQRKSASSVFQDVNTMLRQTSRPPRSLSKMAANRHPSRSSPGPALLSRSSVAPVTPLSSQEAITVQNQESYAGASTPKLRGMSSASSQHSQVQDSNKRLGRRPSVSSLASTSDMPSYLDRMNDEVPSFGRRRTSSIVSVSPSLMFHVKSSEAPEVVLCEDSAMGGKVDSHQNAHLVQDHSSQDLRARLRRQASSASIRTLGK